MTLKNNSAEINVKMKGEYRLQVYSAGSLQENGEAKQGCEPRIDTGFFDNILTDAFFESWLSNTSNSRHSFFSHCGVGQGGAVPAAGDTAITGQLGGRAVRFSTSYSISGYATTTTNVYRFSQNAVIGTVTEVGLFSALSGGVMSSRTLIKDAGGNPTSITLLDGDTLYVTWRGTMTAPQSDATGVISIGGVDYNYVLRPCYVLLPAVNGNYWSVYYNSATTLNATARATQALGSYTSGPAGTSFAANSVTTAAYVSGSKQLRYTAQWLVASGNTGGGIGSVTFTPGTESTTGGWQVSLSAVSNGATVPKNNTNVFSLPITITYGR